MAKCRICDADYSEFISFGDQPIANGFLKASEFEDEYFFELATGYCSNCHMVQLIEQPDREQMFHEQYAFFSSLSEGQKIHFSEFAGELQSTYLQSDDPFAVEIGSNDGIMLKNLAEAGIRHLGVEPSENVAKVAIENGGNTVSEFFDAAFAEKIVSEYGQADTITSANVICHIPYMHSVLEGVNILLKPDGVYIYEDPYLGDIVEKTSYDQIYDEHVFFFSLLSVSAMLERHDMEVFDVRHLDVHGGSMRYYIARKGSKSVTENVERLYNKEILLGLNSVDTYDQLRRNIEKSRDDLLSILTNIKHEQGRPIIAYGATSKSTTVTNYCGIGPDLVEFISDTTPLKQDKFSPGMHIPVLPYEEFVKAKPKYALLFAWNHQKEVLAKESEYRDRGGKWLVYVPEVKFI